MTELNLSLDEYIKQKNMSDQFALLNHRKRDHNIDQDILNADLDQYIQDARASQGSSSGSSTPKNNTKNSSGTDKFNRKSMRSDDESDEDEDALNKTLIPLDDDVEMAETGNLTQNDSNIDDLFKFKTVETQLGIRVPSQQWRMLPENLIDRPEGVQRLAFLPLEDHERYKRVQNGKVNRNYRSRTSSVSSNFSGYRKPPYKNIHAEGKFIEKGKYTYKFGNRGGNEEGIIGIERMKEFDGKGGVVQQSGDGNGQQNGSSSAPQVTVNMNWDTFFDGMHKAEKSRPPPPSKSEDDNLTFAAMRLLNMLKNQRDRNVQQSNDDIGFIDTQPQKKAPLY
jgi:hypothetical protein